MSCYFAIFSNIIRSKTLSSLIPFEYLMGWHLTSQVLTMQNNQTTTNYKWLFIALDHTVHFYIVSPSSCQFLYPQPKFISISLLSALVYMNFLKEVWKKRDEINESYYFEVTSPPPPGYDETMAQRPPAPLPKNYTYTTKSSTSNR